MSDECPLVPQPDTQMIPIEEYEEDGAYTMKAQQPGADPRKDVEVVVDEGILTVNAERSGEDGKGRRRSEFSYGRFTRSVRLTEGVNEEAITASCDKGVLTVTAPVAASRHGARRIPITSG
jgi:HSP20 family molecular chaperone IbpA